MATFPKIDRTADMARIAESSAAARIAAAPLPPFFSFRDLAQRWRCSRASVYNRVRGERIVDFAANGRKGKKLVPLETVLKIERAHLKVLR
jgi:hypothetical protein